MRWLLLLALLPFPVRAQYTVYACMVTSKGYVVGAKLPPSGIFVKPEGGEWRHTGFNLPFLTAVDYDPRHPDVLYAAAGNGLIRVSGGGEQWKILTGSDVTELQDVAVDRHTGDIYFTHTRGIRVSRDGGATWSDASAGLHRKYTQAIRVDRERAGVLIAGNEEGVFRSEDGGRSWKPAGAAGYQVLHVEQSPRDACFWMAGTEGGGLYASRDCGVTFEGGGSLGVGRNIAGIAFDAAAAGRIAVAGWGIGVAVSEDGGKTWENRGAGLPSTSVWSVAFDPGHAGRMYAGVHEEALYVSQDYGKTWTKDGLEGSRVWSLRFVPEVKR
ncbi:MAG: hypothetical protein KGN36_02140 [Acidobacteriota bacterium]|nr:hypothetical protein [Acidobacteriota bacterium]